MAVPKVAARPLSAVVADVLSPLEIGRLIFELQATHWTGRPGSWVSGSLRLAKPEPVEAWLLASRTEAGEVGVADFRPTIVGSKSTSLPSRRSGELLPGSRGRSRSQPDTHGPGYPIRSMIGLALTKSVHAVPTWTKTVALVKEHWALQRALGFEGKVPSIYSCDRFAEKLRDNGEMVERCIDAVVEGLRKRVPNYGTDLRHASSSFGRLPGGNAPVASLGSCRSVTT